MALRYKDLCQFRESMNDIVTMAAAKAGQDLTGRIYCSKWSGALPTFLGMLTRGRRRSCLLIFPLTRGDTDLTQAARS